MTDLLHLDDLQGQPLSQSQIQGILGQIDLDITNLLRDGKLSALKYGIPGPAGQMTDRSANLHALLAARKHYQDLLNGQAAWKTTQADV